MGTGFFALLVIGGVALYFMNAEERGRLIQSAVARIRAVLQQVRTGPVVHDPLHEVLIGRTRRLLVTPALIGISAYIWLVTAAGGTAALVDWGANYAPRTTNGEWWRLAGYTFVHGSFLHLLTTIAALFPLGIVLERAVGRITFAAVYVASGVAAGTVSLWLLPATTMTAGASGAVFGLIGLLIAVLVYGYARAPRLPVSRLAANRLAAGCGLFVIYNLLTDSLVTASELAGFATGLSLGLFVSGTVKERQPAAPRSALVAASTVAIALLLAFPFRGTIDARPDLVRIRDVESKTALEYAQAVDSFTRGRLSSKALADLIQRSILPALQADRARLDKLQGVPREQTRLVAAAKVYFDMREASWRRRLQGLQASSLKLLRDADLAERAALQQFDRLQSEIAGSGERGAGSG
jgi:membrane associated rhomboid family serine protease